MVLVHPFTLLDKRLQHWISKLGFSKPTNIQRLSIEPILMGENALLISPTGTGKTEAAFFPLLHKLLREDDDNGVKLLYINPLKALTRDLTQRIRTYTDFLKLKVRPLYGDVSKAFKKPIPEIIIITPESLEIILDWAPRWWPYFKTIKYVIIDEVHELIFSKRGYQLLVLLERLKQLTNRNLQRICLSATIANAELVAKVFGGSDGKLKVIRSPEERRHEFELKLAIPITQEEMENPFLAGARLVSEYIDDRKSLIFVNSRYSAERLKAEIEKKGISIGVHHGSIGLEERELSEDAFKQGLLEAVIATKTLELGIDIGDVEQVIQYRSPGQVNVLIQRAGRSLHKPGEKSICKIVSTDPEDFLECLALVRLINKGFLEEPIVLEKPLDVLAKEIIGYALHNYRGKKSYKQQFIPIDLNSIYQVVKKCFLFKTLSEKEFEEVVNNLINSGLLNLDNKIPYPGPRFWKVWRFEETETAEWPSLRFNEFFSMIPKRETFTILVEHGFGKRRKLGELDSSFVYRSLATGMVIRFAGSNWKISEIDEKGHNVFVIEAKEGGEIPSWKGEGPSRSRIVAEEMLTILTSIINKPQIIFDFIKDKKTAESISEYISSIDRSYIDALTHDKIVVECVPSIKTWIFITFLGEKINRTIASAIYEKISEKSLLVKYTVSPIGFAFKSEIINPLNALENIDLNEFKELVNKHILKKSPFSKIIKEQLKEHFGFPRNEILIDKEASRQARYIYYKLNEGIKAFERLRRGHLVKFYRNEPSQLGESIIKYPFERPWNVSLRIVLKEFLKKYHFISIDNIFEYVWDNPLEIKSELRNLSRDIDIIAFLDLSTRGWSIAKIPLSEEWVAIKVPVATKIFVIRNDEDIRRIRDELEKNRLPLSKIFNQEIELTFTGINREIRKPYSIKVNKLFEIILDKIIQTHIQKKHRKIDLKIHIKKTRITIIHYGVPAFLLKHLIKKDIITSLMLIEKRIVSERRQHVFELP